MTCNCTGACRRPPYTCGGTVPITLAYGGRLVVGTARLYFDPYTGRARRMTWPEFERECVELWGDDWRGPFLKAAGMTERNLRRWRTDDVVKSGPVTAMLLAFKRLKEAGEPFGEPL